jgi:CheY-like chemotaxis protein
MPTRVLVVEDEESVVALIRVYLEREGLELTVTGDGARPPRQRPAGRCGNRPTWWPR